jgi:hypothetical protein
MLTGTTCTVGSFKEAHLVAHSGDPTPLLPLAMVLTQSERLSFYMSGATVPA